MPYYDYCCPDGHTQRLFLALRDHTPKQPCSCGLWAEQRIGAPLLVKASQDVCYDSPIDGSPITSWAQRREDLAKHGCIPYDPEMKTDATRRVQEADTALDQKIDAHLEEAYTRMPHAQRQQLKKEVVEQGMEVQLERRTA
jgi:hypothetical protein